MAIIEAQGLTRVFRTYQKEEGVRGSLRNLFFRKYTENRAVTDVSFAIEEGEMVGFLGPNGAGKTTTLKMLSGLIHPTSGQARVMGFVPWERRDDYRRQFALVMGQKAQLWMDIPAMEGFLLNREIYGLPDEAFRRNLDEMVDLLEVRSVLKVQVRRLSLGERMKMELIAALLHRPRVLFLDEPTIGLDAVSQKRIRDFLADYNRRHRTTVLLTSHYMQDISSLCRRVIIINGGQIVYDGELARIVRDFSRDRELVITFSEPVAEVEARAVADILKYDPTQIVFRVPRERLTAVIGQILERFPVTDLSTAEIPVEEVISALYQKTGRPKT